MDAEKQEALLKVTKIDLRSSLISGAAKKGQTADQVNRDFKEMNCKPIPFRDLGFPTLERLLLSLHDVCFVRNGLVFPVATEECSHTLRLVQGQKKKQRKAGGKRPMRSRYAPRPPPVPFRGSAFPPPARPLNASHFGKAAPPNPALRSNLQNRLGPPPPRMQQQQQTGMMRGFQRPPSNRAFVTPPKPMHVVIRSATTPSPGPSRRVIVDNCGRTGGPAPFSFAQSNNRPQPPRPPLPSTAPPSPAPSFVSRSRPVSPTPSLGGPVRPRFGPAAAARNRWTKGRVEGSDDWSTGGAVKPAAAGLRAGKKSFVVALAQYNSLDELYFLHAPAVHKLEALAAELTAAFGDRNKAPMAPGAMAFWMPMLRRELEPGLHCVVDVEGYSRAEILSVDPSSSSVEVMCFDYGTKASVSKDKVHHLPAHLAATPRLARRFRMKGWDPVAFCAPDEAALQNFVLRFCDGGLLEPGIRLAVDELEPGVVNVFREVEGDDADWLELAKELVETGLVKTAPAPLDALSTKLQAIRITL